MSYRSIFAPEAHPWGRAPGCINTLISSLLRINQLSPGSFYSPSAIPTRPPMPESHSP